MIKLDMYYKSEWGGFEAGFNQARLKVITTGNIEDKDLVIEHTLLFINKEAFLDSDYLFVKFDTYEYVNLELDKKSVNFGVDKCNIGICDAYFESLTDLNEDDKTEVFYACEKGQEPYAYYLPILKSEITNSGFDIYTYEMTANFYVNLSIKTFGPLNKISSFDEDGLRDFFKENEVKTVYEDAFTNEVSISVICTDFEPTEENLVKNFGANYLTQFSGK